MESKKKKTGSGDASKFIGAYSTKPHSEETLHARFHVRVL